MQLAEHCTKSMTREGSRREILRGTNSNKAKSCLAGNILVLTLDGWVELSAMRQGEGKAEQKKGDHVRRNERKIQRVSSSDLCRMRGKSDRKTQPALLAWSKSDSLQTQATRWRWICHG
eukprot:751501-Hanusia_phi.AAC.3